MERLGLLYQVCVIDSEVFVFKPSASELQRADDQPPVLNLSNTHPKNVIPYFSTIVILAAPYVGVMRDKPHWDPLGESKKSPDESPSMHTKTTVAIKDPTDSGSCTGSYLATGRNDGTICRVG